MSVVHYAMYSVHSNPGRKGLKAQVNCQKANCKFTTGIRVVNSSNISLTMLKHFLLKKRPKVIKSYRFIRCSECLRDMVVVLSIPCSNNPSTHTSYTEIYL